MAKWRVIFHYDVWGNADDGWEVNDSSSQGVIELPRGFSNKQLWNKLVKEGIAKGKFEDGAFFDNGDEIGIDEKKTGMPVFTVRKED